MKRIFVGGTFAGALARVGAVLACLALVCLGIASCVLLAPPSADIAVFSDPHLYDPRLGTDGIEFRRYVAGDRKLIAESSAILDSLVASLKEEEADVVLVAGDLTKDGERKSHDLIAKKLGELERSGKKVYVVPGNHDVLNPRSFGYAEAGAFPVPSVPPEEFARIYKDFGFGEAISRDPHSLSYAAMPMYGLLVLALDACRYEENADYSETGGVLKDETMAWIGTAVEKAKKYNFTVVALMHHGALEHFPGQKTLFADYVVDEWESASRRLADLGVKLVFTGHFHAQDVVKRATESGGFVFDVETGSTVTSPCPYRLVRLGSDGTARITSKRVERIDYDTGGLSFQEYARKFLYDGLSATYLVDGAVRGTIPDMLVQLGLPPQTLPLVAPHVPLIASCFVSHYRGDERLTGEAAAQIGDLVNLLYGIHPDLAPLGLALYALLDDPAPADNEVTIDLENGAVVDGGAL